MERFEEYRSINHLLSWVSVIMLSATIIGFCLLAHHLVMEAPRKWDFGTLEDVPSKSIYSTVDAPDSGVEPPAQIEALPEARPLDVDDAASLALPAPQGEEK